MHNLAAFLSYMELKIGEDNTQQFIWNVGDISSIYFMGFNFYEFL